MYYYWGLIWTSTQAHDFDLGAYCLVNLRVINASINNGLLCNSSNYKQY